MDLAVGLAVISLEIEREFAVGGKLRGFGLAWCITLLALARLMFLLFVTSQTVVALCQLLQ